MGVGKFRIKLLLEFCKEKGNRGWGRFSFGARPIPAHLAMSCVVKIYKVGTCKSDKVEMGQDRGDAK